MIFSLSRMNIVFNPRPFESRRRYLTNRHLGKGRRAKWMEKVKGQRDGEKKKKNEEEKGIRRWNAKWSHRRKLCNIYYLNRSARRVNQLSRYTNYHFGF